MNDALVSERMAYAGVEYLYDPHHVVRALAACCCRSATDSATRHHREQYKLRWSQHLEHQHRIVHRGATAGTTVNCLCTAVRLGKCRCQVVGEPEIPTPRAAGDENTLLSVRLQYSYDDISDLS